MNKRNHPTQGDPTPDTLNQLDMPGLPGVSGFDLEQPQPATGAGAFIPNILETRPFLVDRLTREWTQACLSEDWAFILGMLSTLYQMEGDSEAADGLLMLYSVAGYYMDLAGRAES